MVMGETSLWMFYGFARHEPSIAIFGIVAWSAAATILLRWTSTHRRAGGQRDALVSRRPIADHVGLAGIVASRLFSVSPARR